jgi:predicted DNA-binding transcriptional regulator AlpA
VTIPNRHYLDKRALAIIDQAEGADDVLLSTPEVAAWLGLSKAWLEIGRSKNKGYGPRYIRLSPRRVKYRVGDVKAWLRERAHQRTTEYLDPAGARFGRVAGSRIVDGRVVAPEAGDAQ